MAIIQWHWNEFFSRVGFIVTNIRGWSRNAVKFYSGRGTAGQWTKEGMYRQVDAVIVPETQGQPGAASAICAGLQPR